MGDFQTASPSPRLLSGPPIDKAVGNPVSTCAFTAHHTLLIAVPANPRLHTVVSYWAPATTKSPLPQCYHAHTRLTYDQISQLKHHADHGTVMIPNIGFDLASYLHMQVLMLKTSSEDDGSVPALIKHLKVPGGEQRDTVVRKRDMQVQIMGVQVRSSKAGEKSMLDVVGDGDGNSLMWKWKVGPQTDMWEESLEKAILDAEKRVRGKE